MKRIISISLIIFALLATNASAGSGVEFKFFGINPADFKDRSPLKVIVGGLASHVVHELGHIAIGNLLDMDVAYDPKDRVYYAEDYDNATNDEKALLHAGGFIATTVVGTMITAMPATRHSDYTLGFNGFSTIHDTLYGITGGIIDKNDSDVHNLNELGQSGTALALTSGVYAGILTYISANKDTEQEKNDAIDNDLLFHFKDLDDYENHLKEKLEK